MCAIIWSDYLFYQQEEAFVLAGELGELETLRSSEGDASGSSAVFENAGEEVLAAEAGGVWDGNGAGGILLDSV